MDSRIMVTANEVIKMIHVQLDPSSLQNQRLQAYQTYEEFKRKSPICPDVGLYIFECKQNLEIPVRLCGLQLVEWFVQNNWDTVEPTWRDGMKMKAIKLIELADFKEHDCIKGAIVKVVVEVIKRSWPQLWGSLFEDLSNLQMLGNAQLELVLIVLMRLSEDLNGLDDKVKQQRRKDMVSTLNNHLGELFHFFITSIHKSVEKLKELNDTENLRLSTAALNTIAEYAGWVNFEFLITEEKILFKVLFWLLEIDEIKYNAAYCLCSIFERKGQPEKRVEMMVILSDDALAIVETAAQKAACHADQGNCEEHKFLKKLAEMMLHFGRSQIAALWGEDKGFKERPKCFDKYLKLVLDFTKHESMAINALAVKLWHCFSFHKEIAKDEMYLAAIELLPKEILRMISKLSHPTMIDNPGTKYTMMELDGAEDFNAMFVEIRHSAVDILKQITRSIPKIIFQFVLEKAEQILRMEIPDLKGYSSEQMIYTNHYILWDAHQQFCRHFFVTFFECTSKVITPDVVHKCNEYLNNLINYSCDNPVFLTPVILTTETLFPVFKFSQELLRPSLQKLSNWMLFSPDGPEHLRKSKIKRQAVGILTSLCKKSPELLVDKFDDLLSFFGAKTRENIFVNHEKKLLIEGLLCVSKSLKDTVKMKGFIDEVFEVPLSFFRRDDMKEVFTNTSSFIKFLGLDSEGTDDAAYARRNELIMALYTLEAAARALVITKEDEVNDYPEDREVVQTMSNCPWMQHMIDALPYLFDIARQTCLLWTKVDDHSASFKDVLLQDQNEIKPHDKKAENVAEEEDGDSPKLKPNRQFPVFTTHEAIYTTLSLCGRCLGPVLFSLPGMMDAFIDKVVKSWIHYPNYRMRKVWRAIVKGFSFQCPAKYYESVLGPFLAVALDQMYERLSKEWQRVQELVQEKQYSIDEIGEDESNQSAEINEMRIMYNLSKEVLDILVSMCLFKREKKPVKAEDNVDMFGKLGEFLLTDQRINLQLITIFFTALTWPDASVLDRLCTTITAIVKKMFVPENPVNPEIPNQMMLRLLQGLQIHGGDQIAQSAIVNTSLAVYLQMRRQYPGIVHIMMMVPTCQEEELKKFDIAMFIEVANINESTKRKRFRKFLLGAIGKTVSELHKSDIKIQDLPPLAPRVKPPKPDVITDADDAGLCQLFVPDE